MAELGEGAAVGPGGTRSEEASSHLHMESAQDARVKGSIARYEGAREASREWRSWAKAQQ